MSGYREITAVFDPFETLEFPDGTWRHEIELVLTPSPFATNWDRLEPVSCLIDAARARELAGELLLIANQAARSEARGAGR